MRLPDDDPQVSDPAQAHLLSTGAPAAPPQNPHRKRPSKPAAVAKAVHTAAPPADHLAEILEQLASYEFDPLGFVLWAYPWGEAGTELEHETGPDEWQREALEYIGDQLRQGGDAGAVVLEAIRSGHGVGKSAFSAWVIQWAMSTFDKTMGVATAMTETQLKTKTWAALAKWHNLFIAKHLFEWHALSYRPANERDAAEWRCDAIPWSQSNPSAFQGLHNKRRRILIVYDEAAEIHDVIWEISRGALTDEGTQIIWIALGNPTTTTGEFFEKFGDKGRKEGWKTWSVDSRKSKFSNKALLASWIEAYGEDSDFVRVRVKGMPPRAGAMNFVAPDAVRAARDRDLEAADYASFPIIMALDPAEFGDNESVLTFRQGPKTLRQLFYSGLDGPDLASRVVDARNKFAPSCQFCAVDKIGIGADVCSALRRVKGFPLFEVNVAMPASDMETYSNLRAELYDKARKMLDVADIPDDDRFQEQATSFQYGYDGKMRYQMESKKDMRRRGIESPDRWDSYALTFVPDTIASKPGRKAQARQVIRRSAVW